MNLKAHYDRRTLAESLEELTAVRLYSVGADGKGHYEDGILGASDDPAFRFYLQTGVVGRGRRFNADDVAFIDRGESIPVIGMR